MLAAVLSVSAAVFGIHCEREAHEFMEIYSKVKAKQMMSELFGEIVAKKCEELDLNYENLTGISYSDEGVIQAVNTDIVSVNKLKNAVATEIAEVLDNEYEYIVEIPIGSMFDSEFLSGSGVKLAFNNTVTGDVRSDFRSEFDSSGINQTIHKLYIDISGELIVITGGSTEPITYSDSILLGETVIVGTVPNTLY